MAQTSYSLNQGVGFAGQLSDLSMKRIATGVNKEGTAIPFGVAVTKATGEGNYELPDAGADTVLGIAVHSHDVDQRDLTGTQGIPIDGTFNVLEEGCCYVLVEEAVAQGDPVYVRHTAGAGGTQLGAFRMSADTASAGLVKGAQYRRGAAGGGLAEVEFSKLANLA